ncbi:MULTISPECIES: DUF2867 domain-containing protein [unclassified Sinorhizobium]|uniref:DUF2867 domain-containing protein n=1 Tax=unclassified Sinorhizobium TaxID=2613772 RepID=UPI0024C468D0|nr:MULTISPECIES: DUF2867 domain-containing protein [unclassified Sinorhizobium]MDK1376375.1 DUF2867 domain-containing protein [Sinorhizobium sp. 6-70]MDK1482599.1 DUF2867 domain-containing protein [Sinorhizobium sp. 6-117]
MRPRRVAISLPNPWLPGADWADRHELLVFTARVTAAEAARRALGSASGWVQSLVTWHNRLAPIIGLSETALPAHSGLIGTFPLLHSDDREAVVGYDARHLHFRIVVDVREGPADGQVIGMTTLVRRRNAFGRLCFAAAIPLHMAIVPALLTGVKRPVHGVSRER